MMKAIGINDFISFCVKYMDMHFVRLNIPPSYVITEDVEKRINNFLNEIYEKLNMQIPFSHNDVIIAFDSEKELYAFLKIYEKYKDYLDVTVFLKKKKNEESKQPGALKKLFEFVDKLPEMGKTIELKYLNRENLY